MNTRNSLIIAALALSALCLRADDDEVRFKSRTYTPGKKVNGSTYRPSSYTPSRSLEPAAAPVKKTSSSGWKFFSRKKDNAPATPAHNERLADSTAYTQQKNISVPTIKADPRAIQEKKPLITSNKDTPNSPFTPAEKSEWKNPLLKPRQGIKEHTQ